MICSTCAKSSTLCKADSINEFCRWSATMQLTFALFNPPNQPRKASTPDPTPTAWDDIDETSRLTASAVLARLIARMLAAEQEKGANHD
jgi:hypothetical protein